MQTMSTPPSLSPLPPFPFDARICPDTLLRLIDRYLLRNPDRDVDLDSHGEAELTVVATSGAAHDLRCDNTAVSGPSPHGSIRAHATLPLEQAVSACGYWQAFQEGITLHVLATVLCS